MWTLGLLNRPTMTCPLVGSQGQEARFMVKNTGGEPSPQHCYNGWLYLEHMLAKVPYFFPVIIVRYRINFVGKISHLGQLWKILSAKIPDLHTVAAYLPLHMSMHFNTFNLCQSSLIFWLISLTSSIEKAQQVQKLRLVIPSAKKNSDHKNVIWYV